MKEFNSTSNPSSVVDVADANVMAVQQAQDLAAIKNAAKRQAERQAKYEVWSDPEAMQYRKILHEKEAFESLQRLKASGNYVLQPPVPSDADLPKELRGQQPSTIRAFLAGNPDWQKKSAAYRDEIEKKELRRNELRKLYPEMFGISAEKERKELEDKPMDDYRVSTGKSTFTVKDAAAPTTKGHEPGLVTRIFSGLWKR